MGAAYVWGEEVADGSCCVHDGRSSRLAFSDCHQVVVEVHIVDETGSVGITILLHQQIHLELFHFLWPRKRAIKLKNKRKITSNIKASQ